MSSAKGLRQEHWGTVGEPAYGTGPPGAEGCKVWGLPASSSLLRFPWVEPPAEVGVLLFHSTDTKTEAPQVERLTQGTSQSWALVAKNCAFKSGCLVLHLGQRVLLLYVCFPICEIEVGGFKDQMRRLPGAS